MKSVVYKKLSECDTIPCSSGDGYETEYQYDTEGELVATGRVNVQAIIESHKDEVDIASIVARCLNGDEGALNRAATQYIDTLGMPKDLVELQQIKNNADAILESLTPEDKEAYAKDPEAFFASYGQKSKEQKQEELLAALKDLTGKEVTINE